MSGLYLDTSCLLKMLIPEPETEAVLEIVGKEEQVVVSALARLEALVQLHALRAGGTLRKAHVAQLSRRLDAILQFAPYAFMANSPAMLETAEAQVRAGKSHCRTLDRLHLATMQLAGLRRLMTTDAAQARAAEALGFRILRPKSN